MKKELNHEGYWYSTYEKHLPQPLARVRPFKGKAEFLAALEAVESKAQKRQYKGFSTCRICDCANGSADYNYKDWQWPSGYSHYIKKHNVQPSKEFHEFILECAETLLGPTNKTVEPAVTKRELRQLMGVVMEYTGSEKHRLYAMLTVKKLQRQLNGQKIPASIAALTVKATEDELNKALKRLGD
ncbi:hypothetical protein MPK66_gp275 [Erwinia phage pEa_SNUABM_2]|uniref:Uncharacterized protein n=1 Tax=Erwinia phage pEa_SNUABM_2 TaxID=2869547 RepID=A0AAE7XN38_9CAUD|nr:hypothetical protein MPK66_gp275 [Erwinia phage pEa_SNUABM_2]QZE59519.1 hypothetical protein pEaSNUABM2_00275 [Erwinia phage pEa_SNUABM_2]QZE59856.1 hypothetical protein pEaSNUABM39_00276 [Erwinia phage pEa_SNUABM_39]